MRAIPGLTANDILIFDDIAAAKREPRRTRLRSARDVVLAAYDSYSLAVPDLEGLVEATLQAQQKEALGHAYMVETKPMTDLRVDILDRPEVARCPFCGISESSTLDHYLPKERYPEFSVFSKNLVPCCGVCNPLKRDRILNEGTDVRMFLHPCFDPVPDSDFLSVRVRFMEDALILSYRVVRPATMSERIFQQLRSHFDKLDLADRYRRMSLEYLGEQYRAFSRAYGRAEDSTRVAEKLQQLSEDFGAEYGVNHWRAKLCEALSRNVEFCDGGFEVVKIPT
jgi:hypothetical protein